jgi:hypothetical protein
MTPLMHEWCCRKNGTVPHLPTPYGEEERYGEYERIIGASELRSEGGISG